MFLRRTANTDNYGTNFEIACYTRVKNFDFYLAEKINL